jgi:hypothetical protein
MDSTRFNQVCESLRRDRMVRVRLVTSRVVEGFPISHVKAGPLDGQIELDTRTGPIRLLSSSIEEIEPISDLEV